MSSSTPTPTPAAFELLGGDSGVRRLVDRFYDLVDSAPEAATIPAASVQTASLTWQYTFSPQFSTFNTIVALAVTSPLPRIMLQPEYSVVVAIGAVDAADQVSKIRLQVEQFVTGPQGYLLGVLDDDHPWIRDRQELATALG